jgi:hypothetical protein
MIFRNMNSKKIIYINRDNVFVDFASGIERLMKPALILVLHLSRAAKTPFQIFLAFRGRRKAHLKFFGHFSGGENPISKFLDISRVEKTLFQNFWAFRGWRKPYFNFFGHFSDGENPISKFLGISQAEKTPFRFFGAFRRLRKGVRQKMGRVRKAFDGAGGNLKRINNMSIVNVMTKRNGENPFNQCSTQTTVSGNHVETQCIASLRKALRIL